MTESTLDDEIYDLRFYLQRSVRYHMRRASFFVKWQRITSFVGVVFGSAALTTFIEQVPDAVAIYSALIITVASAFDLVVGTGQHAWQHNDLRKRFLELAGELDARPPSEKLVAYIWHKIRRIEADEPAARELLNLMVRNDVIRSKFSKEEADGLVANICWVKRATANLVDWGIEKY
ncbi:MAG: hypothetical protein V7756_16490 [Halopseudomonas sp.]|uniref:hypothetical protein n=1 Tax=Halopseudomonas sp. TaxID=2901191 RepID=UPI0030017C94